MAIDTLEFCLSDRRYPGNQTKCRGTAIKLLPWPQNWRKRTNKKIRRLDLWIGCAFRLHVASVQRVAYFAQKPERIAAQGQKNFKPSVRARPDGGNNW